ncbi:UDP-N-acetylmuramate dehydrogenase [Mycobacterium sp. CBMA271]|uniref:UDP-N-acetylmuramate dehydrogenase n=1 Tax=unclassified Mycobacteroides TaxID=2618759 RepID=UPI001322C4F9|nr:MULTISPECIES: UDP-N-acetylmuramate dehydrogenase [unclassified Mycobacteroides]MUM19729.1 UDP-N-acetylenolpyruvoylglucosamine reductase [Mycobacteroides sp. CBMA 326]MUM21116.1 UDP-N-acetylmuramate dehydrogenase [Mycobacteroides sp. CBMA 271]
MGLPGTTRAEIEDLGAVVTDDAPLAALTTLRLGPVASTLIRCDSSAQVVGALAALDGHSTLLLAGGSNVVLADDLPDLAVVHIASAGVTVDGPILRADAGANWDEVVALSMRAGLGGLECLSGIPGTAGATPVQNVGAYGVEVASLLRRVRVLDRATGVVRWYEPGELGFGYRTSLFKGADARVVLEVEFGLTADGLSSPIRYPELAKELGVTQGDRTDALAVREAVLVLRRRKGMVLDASDHDTWSVGSFFTNPVIAQRDLDGVRARVHGRLGPDVAVPQYPAQDGVKLSAGWLVERAGFVKGYPGERSAVRVSTKHALALTHRGGGSTGELLRLARTVRDGVLDAFGVRLVPEPVLVGCSL